MNKKYEELHSELSNVVSKEIEKVAQLMAEKFIKDHDGWWYTILSYSDSNSYLYEIGEVFKHIKHIRISHH